MALVLVGVFRMLPRLREGGRVKKRERELGQRRDQVIGENREEAEDRERQAEQAEQRARIAEQEARRRPRCMNAGWQTTNWWQTTSVRTSRARPPCQSQAPKTTSSSAPAPTKRDKGPRMILLASRTSRGGEETGATSQRHALVERWFAELTVKKLKRSAHTSVRQLNAEIRAWIKNWNENPQPYVWTKPAQQILESISRYCQRINQTGH